MKNGNLTPIVIGVTLVASIAFAGGYFLGLDRDSSLDAFKTLRKTVAQQKDSIQAYQKQARERNAKEEKVRPAAAIPEADRPKTTTARKSVRELLFQARAESNPIARLSAFAEALADLNEDNLDEVLEAYDSMPFGFEHMQEYRMLLYAWGQFDPTGAIEYCNKRASGMGAGFATTGVLEGWASRDPDSARA